MDSPEVAQTNGCPPLPESPNLMDITEDGDHEELLLLNLNGPIAEIEPPSIPTATTIVPKTPPLMIGLHSDEDSVCADIDRWAGSSLEEDEGTSRGSSQLDGSTRLQELEAEQQRLGESMLSLSTQFAQIQFRIQQIAQAPAEQRDEMLKQLQEFASKSCLDFGQLKSTIHQQNCEGEQKCNKGEKAQQVRMLIGELRNQLGELEQFAWKNGHLGPDELPLSELRERQRLVLEKLREKMRIKVELAGPEADADQEAFRKKLDEGLELAMEPIREKDQLVHQLRTQIVDLERYVHLLQQEVLEAAENGRQSAPNSPSKQPLAATLDRMQSRDMLPANQQNNTQMESNDGGGWLNRWFGGGNGKRSTARNFERNELKNTPMGNHYGDQRAEMELAVDELMQVMRKNQILSVDREDRGELSVDELNKVILEGGQEAILTSVRKRLCPALRSLLEHGLRPQVVPTPKASSRGLLASIGCFPDRQRINNNRFLRPGDLAKFDGRKLEHIWDVLVLFLEASRALEMRDAVVGQLSDAFKLETVAGKTATSKQILLSTIEHINNSHMRLRRSPESMWKAFVCAAMNRNRLPAWIRIIFRSEFVLLKCYNSWSYVARTGVEDIRPLLEGLHEFNFDLPVDLAVRPFEHIKEAFG